MLRSVVPQQEVPSSILRRNGHERNNNNRNVQFGVFCTAQPFNKRLPPVHLSSVFKEELIPIQFKLSRVEEEEQPPKEEVVMSIGDDAGAKPVEPIEQWKRTEGLRSKIAVAGEESAAEMEVPPSILLLQKDRERNNSRRVQFSAISTLQPFKKKSSPANLKCYFQEVRQLIRLKLILHKVVDSILYTNDCERNNGRNVRFSAISTAQPFNKRLPAEDLSAGFKEERQLIRMQLTLSRVVEEDQPQEEEEQGLERENAVSAEESAAFDIEEQSEELISHVVVEALPQDEEEILTFEDAAGDEPAELIEQYQRKGGLRREVAALQSNLGDYWSGELPAKRVRRRPERFTQ